jgi:catechol 2,3-dioxygenase-like lactoylglutathione lyase family enzyme
METTGTPRVTGVDFVAIPTADAEAAVAWYTEVLGLERSKQWGQMPAYEVETENLTIALMQVDAFGLEFSPNAAPVALRVDDVGTARADLEAKGVRFPTETIDSGACHMAPFADPDGNALLLHHRYAKSQREPSGAVAEPGRDGE